MHFAGALALVIAILSLPVIGNCAAPDPEEKPIAWGPVRTYSGSYWAGWESSDFTPSGRTETWWLSGNLAAIDRRRQGHHPELRNPLFITVEGQLSSPGHYGHLGQFPRELRVTRVISVKWPR
jgi:hypothetical protein